ncbi:MAG: hypothetical protein A4S14_17030 [Proteobacteria bacterium SG_bin9]|nr:MAG: hypothetical protein A4S14_17030 [Proteobacteria bacterium SG_bin9]
MKRWSLAAMALLALGLAATPVIQGARAQSEGGWVTLFDGKNLDNFTQVGDANWKLANGEVSADNGSGFLVTKQSYGDVQIRIEFWADDDTNSGIFTRLSDPAKITADNSYEINIYDKRPDPSYGTGAIVNIAKVSPMPKAGTGSGGKWSTFDITLKGSKLTVIMNGQKTVEAEDSKFAKGPFALQRYPGISKDPGVGPVKFRKVEVKPL